MPKDKNGNDIEIGDRVQFSGRVVSRDETDENDDAQITVECGDGEDVRTLQASSKFFELATAEGG